MREKLKKLLENNIVKGSSLEKHKHKIPSVVERSTDDQVEFFINLDEKISKSGLFVERKTRFDTVNSIDYFVKNGKKFFNQKLNANGQMTFYFNGRIIDKLSLFPLKQTNGTSDGQIYPDMSKLDYVWDLAKQSYESKK